MYRREEDDNSPCYFMKNPITECVGLGKQAFRFKEKNKKRKTFPPFSRIAAERKFIKLARNGSKRRDETRL